MRNKIATIATWVGLALILTGIFIPLATGPREDLFKYVFASGAAINLIGRVLFEYDGPNIRVKRLLRIEVWAGLFFCVAAYFMFTANDPKDWIVFVLAGGAIMVYTSIMIPYAQRKK